MLGVILILASTIAYNGSVVLLAAVARRHAGSSTPLVAVSQRASGLFAIFMNLLGWALEIAALTMIPLTLARVLSVAGIGVLLGLSRWALGEPLGRREILGAAFIALGTAAVALAPPQLGTASPAGKDWILLLVILGPGVALPYILRAFSQPVSVALGATSSGVAYALSGVFTKGTADVISSGNLLLLVLLSAGMLITGLLGFVIELDALHEGQASVVVPIVLALHTVVPIVCAPIFFQEDWPTGLIPRVLLGGGISFTLIGTLVLSSAPGRALKS